MEILKERYSITELAEMLQLTDHALRFYEKECELSIPKDERGRRYYTTDLANIMYKIKVMRSEGLEIKAIKKILQDDNVFGQPEVVRESSGTSVIPAAGKEYEAMQVIFSELGKQLTREISYELDNTREHLLREISKASLSWEHVLKTVSEDLKAKWTNTMKRLTKPCPGGVRKRKSVW